MHSFELTEAYITGVLSLLSFLGSILVLVSYVVAIRKTSPNTASRLIRNLAISDAVWFLSTLIEAGVWVAGAKDGETGDVPNELCYVVAPLVMYGRMTSLFWTCCISYDLLNSIERRERETGKREAGQKSIDETEDSAPTSSCCAGYIHFYIFVNSFSLPGPLITMIQVHTSANDADVGCSAGYEELGSWYLVAAADLIPVMIGFFINIFIFLRIRAKMNSPNYPLVCRLL